MSAALTKARRGPVSTLAVPRVADPLSAAQVNQSFAAIEQYEGGRISRETQSIPTFKSMRLVAPNGTTYQLTVDNNGNFMINPVPRT